MIESFKHHDFDENQVEKSNDIRQAAEDLAAVIVLRCVPSREKSLAMTKLEECVMWANKSLALYGVWKEDGDGQA